jgi:hypothetical protein
MTGDNVVMIRLRKRPFLARLWRHYRYYRNTPFLRWGRIRAFRQAWNLARC